MLNSKKFAILTADGVKRINTHNHTKFSGDHYRDIVIFRFLRWQQSTMLDF